MFSWHGCQVVLCDRLCDTLSRVSGIDELIEQINADLLRMRQLKQAVLSTADASRELAENFSQLSAARHASLLTQVSGRAAEVVSQFDSVAMKLEQALAMVNQATGASGTTTSTPTEPPPTKQPTAWRSSPDLARASDKMTNLGKVSAMRRIHILDGDKNGGGHAYGTGRPGKTEFPKSWDDDKVIRHTTDVARRPDETPILQANGRWSCMGTREQVNMRTIVDSDGGVRTAHPIDGPGVHRNSKGS